MNAVVACTPGDGLRSRRTRHRSSLSPGGLLGAQLRKFFLCTCLVIATPTGAALPPVPVPPENPLTEPKRVLGKMLFWDEQLSSDNTIACGTCHQPAAGGADPRHARHPGLDAGTIDDVLGSPGITRLDQDGNALEDPLFGFMPQVTRRVAPSVLGSLWADTLFWDGRAGAEFRDPLTGAIVIRQGGALENQVLASLMDTVEMTRPGRSWDELAGKLAVSTPLALATGLPRDLAARLASRPSYPELFAAAFGDGAITPVRIAFAIASYERTLVADQTPWDVYQRGMPGALDDSVRYGWQQFQDLRCVNCHAPPLFSNNDFANIGLRRVEYDRGREVVSGLAEHAGDMKVPSLRNVALRPRLMHTGEFASVAAAVGFYNQGNAFPERDVIPGGGSYSFNLDRLAESDLRAFLLHALTDPRVAAEAPPFDRPLLRTERAPLDTERPAPPVRFDAQRLPGGQIELRWTRAPGDTDTLDYVLRRDGRVIALLTATRYVDAAPDAVSAGWSLIGRDAALNEAPPLYTRAVPAP